MEIFWPHEWLKGGITIIETPGIGESRELDDMIKAYLPKTCGIIYVINTPNAGGIDPERVSVRHTVNELVKIMSS